MNKYRSETTTLTKNNNLDYLIDPTFRNINRLFVLSFKNGNDDPTRDSFDKYNIPLIKIKDFNALKNNKVFFDQPVKKQEVYEKLMEISKNNDYTTGYLASFLYHQNYYKLIGNDSKFVTRKWTIVNDLSNANYDVRNEFSYNKKF